MNRVMILSAAMGVFASGLAVTGSAHHAATMFDRSQTIELTGEVVEFQWTSPHVWIQINVASEAGEPVEWSVEGSVPNRLYRAGWRPNTFQPGDRVTIRAAPMKNGGKAALFIGAKLADGSTLGSFD